jgi:hypothetical protein
MNRTVKQINESAIILNKYTKERGMRNDLKGKLINIIDQRDNDIFTRDIVHVDSIGKIEDETGIEIRCIIRDKENGGTKRISIMVSYDEIINYQNPFGPPEV